MNRSFLLMLLACLWLGVDAANSEEREIPFSNPDLPPLLECLDGTRVQNMEDWQRRREEILTLLCDYFWGHFPKEVPAIQTVELVSETRERGSIRREVEVEYNTIPAAAITFEILMPEGGGPFPVFLTQSNHRRWAMAALARGYLCCVYPGADINDRTQAFADAYPECDWTLIPKRAWLGCRALDYVLTMPEADADCVSITGHSRNGKQALIAAAIDPRITAVVSSSSGSPAASPYRFTSDFTFAESPEYFPDPWFNLRLRQFVGREHELPIDSHGILALIAPRACLLSTAMNDGCEPTFAVERNYLAAREVYRFLNSPEAFRIRWRSGGHDTNGEDIQSYLDWFDRAFGRGDREFPETFIHQFDWNAWRADQADEAVRVPFHTVDAKDNDERRRRIEWALGDAPPMGVERGGMYDAEPDYQSALMTRDRWAPDGVHRFSFNFGEHIYGNAYHIEGADKPYPVVIWLHPYSYMSGSNEGYGVSGTAVYHRLAQAGYFVVTFDQIGFGLRIEEGKNFYDRYPNWSRLGKMVCDVRSLVDCILDGEGRFPNDIHPREDIPFPPIDSKRITCVGFALGGMVGLYAAAFDDRITGVASFSGFTPLRTNTDGKFTGGNRRLWEWHGLQPRLGLFCNQEAKIPYDFNDVLQLIAPRPCLIVAPLRDRLADVNDVRLCVKRALPAWQQTKNESSLTLLTPDDYNRFQIPQQDMVLEWLRNLE